MNQFDNDEKGNSLFRLQDDKYNVPRFFVLDTRSFDDFLKKI